MSMILVVVAIGSIWSPDTGVTRHLGGMPPSGGGYGGGAARVSGLGKRDGAGRGREGRHGEEERRPGLRGGEGDKEPRLYFLLKI